MRSLRQQHCLTVQDSGKLNRTVHISWVHLTKHVINESVSIATFPLPLKQGYLHDFHVVIASSSHIVFGRIAVAPLLNDNDHDHLFSRFSLSVLTALTLPVCQSAWALALIGCRNRLSMCTCTDFVSLERSGPVPALEMEMCLCVLWSRWCLCPCPWNGVVWLLSSLRCLLYIDI